MGTRSQPWRLFCLLSSRPLCSKNEKAKVSLKRGCWEGRHFFLIIHFPWCVHLISSYLVRKGQVWQWASNEEKKTVSWGMWCGCVIHFSPLRHGGKGIPFLLLLLLNLLGKHWLVKKGPRPERLCASPCALLSCDLTSCSRHTWHTCGMSIISPAVEETRPRDSAGVFKATQLMGELGSECRGVGSLWCYLHHDDSWRQSETFPPRFPPCYNSYNNNNYHVLSARHCAKYLKHESNQNECTTALLQTIKKTWIN